MFKLNLHIHSLLECEIPFPFDGKGQPFLHPHPPKSPVKPGAQGITKLLLILWGEPHRNKKHWEGVTLSPPGVAQGERGYLRGRKHKRDPLQTQVKGMPLVLGPVSTTGENLSVMGLAQAHRRRARGLDTKPQRYLGSSFFSFAFFCFCCMISESLGVEMMGHWEVPEGKKDKMQGYEGHKG